MKSPKEIQIEDFNYPLPEERIAKFPLEQRDQSKLLVYKQGTIRQDVYKNIEHYLPENAALVFNNTRVVQARMHFTNRNGKTIEIFCLEPAQKHLNLALAMSETASVEWICLVGGAKKWKEEFLSCTFAVNNQTCELKVEKLEALSGSFKIRFSWSISSLSFAEILDAAGITPLPPYLKRNAEDLDKTRYQTVYAQHDGSVAAPTAGLHFTETVFSSLQKKNIEQLFVTLHVGAGTFKPVQTETIADHDMHFEYIHVQLEMIEKLLNRKTQNTPIVSVGTTSMRTLESLYWLGVKTAETKNIELHQLEVFQWDPYELNSTLSPQEALSALIDWMKSHQLTELVTRTQLMIAPGYDLKIVDALATNFHQPKSTLLLLISALVGTEWKTIYDYALHNDFRFLSYGDGSLLFKDAFEELTA